MIIIKNKLDNWRYEIMEKQRYEACLKAIDTLKDRPFYIKGYKTGIEKYYNMRHNLPYSEPESKVWQLADLDYDDYYRGYQDGVNGRSPHGFHYNIGRTPNKKLSGDIKDQNLTFRIKSSDRKQWELAAKKAGLSLGQWINTQLNLQIDG